MKQRSFSIVLMAVAVLYALGLLVTAWQLPEQEKETLPYANLDYETRLFDTSRVHTIDIQVEEADWKAMKQRALYKECIDSTVLVDGEEFFHVGVRTKGNSTLLFNAAKGWDRFSLVLEFDAFQDSQRYHGLDSVALYNNMFDASYMKSYLCFELMRAMGVPTPLCSFAAVYLNGEYVGLYAASETFSESFALRSFGYDYGQIYKPEHMDIGAMLTGELQNTKINLGAFRSDGRGGGFSIDTFFRSSNDAVRLAYLGESLYAYEDIWRNASFPIGTSDKNRVVEALRRIREKEDPEAVVDMDALARYFAVNTFVLNTDCYTTGMAHNYALYEKDGILSMLPWDYDVALGNIGSEFGVSDPSVFINQPIDTPVFSTTVEERPMLDVLLSSPQGRELYHRYLDQLVEQWIESGKMEETVRSLEAMIRPWVMQDTAHVYTHQDHAQAVESILAFSRFRGESVRGQLTGDIPATAQGQAEAPEALVDCSVYAPPDSGILSVLLPGQQSDEVTLEAVLEILPPATENLHTSINVLAMLNLVDVGELLSMDFSALKAEGPSTIDKEALLPVVMPYAIALGKLLLTWIAIPIVLVVGLRTARRWNRQKGGSRRVV